MSHPDRYSICTQHAFDEEGCLEEVATAETWEEAYTIYAQELLFVGRSTTVALYVFDDLDDHVDVTQEFRRAAARRTTTLPDGTEMIEVIHPETPNRRSLAPLLAVLIIGLVLMAIFAVAVTAEEASASEAAHRHSHKCADVIGRPTDARCEYYVQVRREYLRVDNDRYVLKTERLDRRGYHQAANIRVKAAKNACHGTLYEDMSCKGRTF